MTSMQDALTEALEHPIAKAPGRPKPLRKAKSRGTKSGSQGAGSLIWGLVGIAVSVILLGVSKRFMKPQPVSAE